MADLAGGHADRSFSPRPKRLAKPAVLVIDDFAMRDFTVAQADDFYELVCDESAGPDTSMILTSNRSPADWYPLFPNAVVGESVLDRVINSSHHLLLDGKSYRPSRRPGRARPGPLLPRRAPETTAALRQEIRAGPSLPRPQRGASDSQCPAQPVTPKH